MQLFDNLIISKKLQNCFLLLLLTLFGYWQVAFMQYAMKWDMIDQFYPWRFFVGECLQNSILPLWNPYQVLGYPIHADPGSGAWYPITWLIALFRGYDIYSSQFEFVLHIFLAGVGMYKLAKGLKLQSKIALLLAISYLFSGFFVGNAQHLTFIISGAWIPFIIYYFLDAINRSSYRAAIKTGFCMFMLISGGYPGLLIITSYLLLIIAGYDIIKNIKNKDYKKLKLLLKINLAMFVTTVLLSSVIIVSIFNALPHITRATELTIELMHSNPFSPQSLISLLLPFAVIKDMIFFNTDVSMTNIYFGIIPCLFFVFSLLIKKSKIEWLFLLCGIFCLSASMGECMPVRELLYRYVPMMNLFRHPAIFRLFTILCFLILAGFALEKFIKDVDKHKKALIKTVLGLQLILTCFLAFSFYNSSWKSIPFLTNWIFYHGYDGCSEEFLKYSTLSEHIALQSIVQLLILSVFLYIIVQKHITKGALLKYGTILLVIDLFLATQFNTPVTIINNIKTKVVKENVSKLPKGFPLPSDKKIIDIADVPSLHELRDNDINLSPLWKNLNIFYKQTAYDGYNPFDLKNYTKFEKSPIFQSTLNNNLIFLSDHVFSNDSLYNASLYNQNENIYLSEKDYKELPKVNFEHSGSDTVYITNFSANHIVAKAKSSSTQLLMLLQNNYPGWNVYINGTLVPHYTSNLAFISVLIHKGESVVEFIYKPTFVIISFYVSLASLLLFLIIIPGNQVKKLMSYHLRPQ